MNDDIGIGTRGVEQGVFNPGRRDMAWRRSLGIEDDVPAIAFLGRLVMEKGLDVFADAIDRSEEHTSELQSLMRISYAVFCLKKKKKACNQSSRAFTTNATKKKKIHSKINKHALT